MPAKIEKAYNVLKLAEDPLKELNDVLDYLEDPENEIVAFDIETDSANERKARVIGIGVSCNFNEGVYVPFWQFDKAKNELVRIIDEVTEKEFVEEFCQLLLKKKLVMHNGVFDIVVMWHQYGIDLTPALYADTILMKHTVDEDRPFGLKEVANLYKDKIGFDRDEIANQEQVELKDSVQQAGGKWTQDQKDIYKGSMEIIGKYCCADVDLTLRLFDYFDQQLEKEGLLEFFYDQEVMPLYCKATIPMKMGGVFVDIEYFKALEKEVESGIMKLTQGIFDLISEDVKPFVKEVLADKVKETKTGKFAEGVLRYYNIPIPSNKKTGKPTLAKSALQQLQAAYPGHPALAWLLHEPKKVPQFVEQQVKGEDGIIRLEKVQKLVDDPNDDGPKLPEEVVSEVKRQIFTEDNPELPHVFNLASNDHISWLIFKKYGKEPISHSRTTGKAQVNKDSLEAFDDVPFVSELLKLKKQEKLISTYIRPILETNINGWIYPSMLQFGTTSGRYSCAGGLNLQTLPRFERPKSCDECDSKKVTIKDTSLININIKCSECGHEQNIYNGACVKKGFIAPKGYKVVNADFSSLEPRIFSWVSGDEGLKHVWRAGLDLYSQIAIDVFNLEGYSARESDSNYLKKANGAMRNLSKVFTLAVPYGANEYRIGGLMKKDPREAKDIIDNYLNSYPQLKEYMEVQESQIMRTGTVQTQFGRVRHLPEAKRMYSRYGGRILNKKAMERELGDFGVEEYYRFRNYLNNSKNFPIQATAAHVCNAAMIKLSDSMKKHKIQGHIALQIHDEICCLVKEEDAERTAQLLQDAMQNNPITEQIDIPILAEPIIADNFAEAK